MNGSKEKAPGDDGAQGFQKETQNRHSAISTPSAKDITTLQAEFALAGHQLIVGKSGDFMVTRWGLSKHLPDWPAVQQFAKLVEVRNGLIASASLIQSSSSKARV